MPTRQIKRSKGSRGETRNEVPQDGDRAGGSNTGKPNSFPNDPAHFRREPLAIPTDIAFDIPLVPPKLFRVEQAFVPLDMAGHYAPGNRTLLAWCTERIRRGDPGPLILKGGQYWTAQSEDERDDEKELGQPMKQHNPNLPEMYRHPRPGVRQTLVGFEGHGARTLDLPSAKMMTWTTSLHSEFLPLGLLFWGATHETFVTDVRVGNQSGQVSRGVARIPARYFETGKSFDELVELAEQGELALEVKERQLLQMNTVGLGVYLQVGTEGPFESFCLWGLSPVSFEQKLTSNIERVENDKGLTGYRGTLVRSTLVGDITEYEAKAPSEASIVQLLINAKSGKYYG